MLKKFVFIIFVLFVNIFLLNIVHAADTGSAAISAITGGASTLSNGTCPSVIEYHKDTNTYTLKSVSSIIKESANITSNPNNNADSSITYNVYQNGQIVQNYTRKQLLTDFAKQYANLQCPPTITGLQSLFLRILAVVNSIIGLVLFYVFVKAGFMRMTARGNPDAVKNRWV